MKANRKLIEQESKRWVNHGIIDQPTARRLVELYPQGTARNAWLITFAVIGGIFCLCGIALLISANWQEIPDLVKFVALLALLAGSGSLAIESERRAWPRGWWEPAWLAAAIFPLLGLMLISQIFNVHGEPLYLFLTWLVAISPIPFLSRSVSGLIAWLTAQYAVVTCLVDQFATHREEYQYFVPFIILGAILTGTAVLWRKYDRAHFAGINEYIGLLTILVAGYIWSCVADDFLWLGILIPLMLGCAALIYRGFTIGKQHQVTLGLCFIALGILTIFLRLIGTMLETGMLFLAGGIAILGVVFLLHRVRGRLISHMQHTTG